MKRLLILLLLGFLPTLTIAQIQFEKGNWASVKAKAAKENKVIMIDFYTTWCGPCKVMDKNIFPLKNVGGFYNANFINYKIDAEKGEGTKLAQKYGIKQFPTYIFANANGDFIHQFVGSMSAEKFIAGGKESLDPSKQSKNLISKDKDISKGGMPEYLRKLSRKRLPFNSKYEAYIKSLSDKELYTQASFDLMMQLGGRGTDNFTYKLILDKKNAFKKAIGNENITNYIYQKLLIKAYGFTNRKEANTPVIEEANKLLGIKFGEKIDETIKLTTHLYKSHDYEVFIINAKKYLKKYADDTSLKQQVVFNEGLKFFLNNENLNNYIKGIGEELIVENGPRSADIAARLGRKFVSVNQLEMGLSYYKRGLEIAKSQGADDLDLYAGSIKFINNRIAIIKEGKYIINGKGFDVYNGLIFKISYSNPNDLGKYTETEGVTIVDGKFAFTGITDVILKGNWTIYEGNDFKKKGSIIIEPGTYPLTLNKDESFLLESPYNYHVFNAWKTNKSYKSAIKAYKDFRSTPNINMKNPITRKEDFKLKNEVNKIKENHFMNTFKYNPDPVVKALVALEGLLFSDKGKDKSGSKRLAILKNKIPDHYLIKTMEYYESQEK